MKKLLLTFLVILVSLTSNITWGADFPGPNSSSQCAYGSNGSVSCGGMSSFFI